MEILLAIVVASAVIFFGALISMGNERQRKAIDGLREQIVQWAIKDIRIKGEQINFENRITEPLKWLNKTVERNTGIKTNLQFEEYFQDPQALICVCKDNTHLIIFSPLSPSEIRRINKDRQNQLTNYAVTNKLLSLNSRNRTFEVNSLNSDMFFFKELSVVWNLLTGEELNEINRLWIYLSSK